MYYLNYEHPGLKSKQFYRLLHIVILRITKYFCNFLQTASFVNYFFFFLINTFIQQGCIKLIKIDSKYIYNVTKDI